MRFYQYTARNNLNQPVQGTMQASTEEEARQALGKFGLQLLSVTELSQQPRQPMPPMQRQAPGPPPTVAAQPPAARRYGTTPVSRPARVESPQNTPYSYGQAAPVQIATPATTSQGVVHTVNGTDKERFFLFSQLASALRAGINPSQAFHEIAMRSPAHFRPSLEEAANAATAEGKSISQVFARYPDLYPDHVVGTVRAGEVGGFVPEAMNEVARQAESSHAFRRWFFWAWFMMVNFLLSIPGAWIANRTILDAWNNANKTGGAGVSGTPSVTEGVGTFFALMWHEFLWPWGPLTLAGYVAVVVFRRYYMSRVALPFRHRMGLKAPVYGKRTQHENLARFCWTMSRVSRAGVAPSQTWQLAADSVPNVAFRDELHSIGSQFNDSTKMSDVIHRSTLFPPEYAPMMATAEYTGDLPSALEQLSNVSAGEFVAAQNYAKIRSGCWVLLGFFITSAIAVGMLLYVLDVAIPRSIMNETDNTP